MIEKVEKDIDNLIDRLIESYPALSISNILNDLEKSIEQVGVKVSYADLNHIETKRGFEKIEGYARVLKNGSPTIVVNGNSCLEERRSTMAHLVSEILLFWRWKPYVKVKLNKDLYAIHQLQSNGNSVKGEYVSRLAANLLLPKGDVQATLDFFEQTNNRRLQETLAEGLLSSAYKVPLKIVKEQIRHSNI